MWLLPYYSELYLRVKNHTVDKTLPVCVIQHCIWDNELVKPVLPKVVVVVEVQTQPLLSPWAGATTFDAIARMAQNDAAVALEFASPTAFRHDGRRNAGVGFGLLYAHCGHSAITVAV